MPTHRQGTTSKTPALQGTTLNGLPGSDPARLSAVFSGTPYGEGTDYDLQNQANAVAVANTVSNGEANDGGHTFGTFNRDFADGADTVPENVPTGPAGLPGTAFTPNTASPGEGSLNPLDLPVPPAIPVVGGGAFNRGENSQMPGATIPQLGAVTLGSYLFGQSYNGSDIKP